MGLEPASSGCCSCSGGPLVPFLDLGPQPMAGWFPRASDAPPDATWPLRPAVCASCWLVQLADQGPDEFNLAGAPLPTSSTSMQAHARTLVANLIRSESVQAGSRVIEVASHGGYLQPYFADRGVVTTTLEDQPARAERVRATGGAAIDGSLEELGRAPTPLSAHSVDLFVDHYLLSHLRRPEAALEGIAWLLTDDPRASVRRVPARPSQLPVVDLAGGRGSTPRPDSHQGLGTAGLRRRLARPHAMRNRAAGGGQRVR
ncbi:MAG: class I SAM-dependent methyltransferase [Actinomycetes bacterium]